MRWVLTIIDKQWTLYLYYLSVTTKLDLTDLGVDLAQLLGDKLETQVPPAKLFQPLLVESIAPCSGYTEKVIQDIITIFLNRLNNCRESGAVNNKLWK